MDLDLTQWTRRSIARAGCDHEGVALSPDKRHLAVHTPCPGDNGITVFDSVSGEVERVLTVGYEPVFVFVSDTVLATYGNRGKTTVGLWDVTSGTMIRELPVTSAVQGFGQDMVVSADGRLLGLARFGVRPSPSGAEVWELETGTRHDMTTLGREDPHPWQLDFSPDGSTIQTLGGWAGRNLATWDTATGQRGPTLNLPGWGRALSWRPDGTELALAWHDMGRDGVHVFDGLGGNELRSRILDGEVVGGGIRFHPGAPDNLLLATNARSLELLTVAVRGGPELRLVWSDDVVTFGRSAVIADDGSMIVVTTVADVQIWEN